MSDWFDIYSKISDNDNQSDDELEHKRIVMEMRWLCEPDDECWKRIRKLHEHSKHLKHGNKDKTDTL